MTVIRATVPTLLWPCMRCHQPTTGLYCDACLAARLASDAPSSALPTPPEPEDLTEAQIQSRIVNALQSDGWRVWRVGQRNARGTQDAGVADLIACHATHGLWFLEVKRPAGEQSMPQREFEEAVTQSGGRYALVWSLERLRAVLA